MQQAGQLQLGRLMFWSTIVLQQGLVIQFLVTEGARTAALQWLLAVAQFLSIVSVYAEQETLPVVDIRPLVVIMSLPINKQYD
jgi:hypothetical protein